MNGGAGALALVGPTGTSKTAVSLALASHLDAEIVCADSRQLYRELEAATGKPTPSERARVPHHLFDWLEISESASAGRYALRAQETLDDIARRGRVPLVVGGSGLYLRALSRGLASIPAVPDEVRRRVREELEAGGTAALHEELASADPVLAARISVRDRQRVGRAVEVLRATGRPLSEWQAGDHGEVARRRWLFVGLTAERDLLYERLDRRTTGFFEGGLLPETRGFLERGFGADAPGLQSLGYEQAVQHLLGRLSYTDALDRAQRETRRYAKRQWTWWRSEGPRVRLRWVQLGERESPESVARRVEALWREDAKDRSP